MTRSMTRKLTDTVLQWTGIGKFEEIELVYQPRRHPWTHFAPAPGFQTLPEQLFGVELSCELLNVLLLRG